MKYLLLFPAALLIISLSGVIILNTFVGPNKLTSSGEVDPSPTPVFIEPESIPILYNNVPWSKAEYQSLFSEEGSLELEDGRGRINSVTVPGVGWTTTENPTIDTSGWLQEQKYKNLVVRGLTADGPGNSIESFVKVFNSKVQVLTIYKANTTTVFASFPISIEDLL